MDDALVTIEEARKILGGVSEDEFHDLISNGRLRFAYGLKGVPYGVEELLLDRDTVETLARTFKPKLGEESPGVETEFGFVAAREPTSSMDPSAADESADTDDLDLPLDPPPTDHSTSDVLASDLPTWDGEEGPAGWARPLLIVGVVVVLALVVGAIVLSRRA